MKLASLKSGRDGRLVVVSKDCKRARAVPHVARTMQDALDRWEEVSSALAAEYASLSNKPGPDDTPFDPSLASAPLPRAYQWCDGSTFFAHTERMYRWRKMDIPPVLHEEPLVYQGGSDTFLGPRSPIIAASESWGIDFESELAVVTDDVPTGANAAAASGYIKLVMLCNDVSFRNLIPRELGKGFGFYQSKPSSSFGPIAITPDELGNAWDGRRIDLTVRSSVNGIEYGHPNSGPEMKFGFDEIIAHAAKTRDLVAGSIFGSGTIANKDPSVGSSCITEKRMLEEMESGEAKTNYLKYGDTVRIEAFDSQGASVFGAIEQSVAPPSVIRT